MCFDFQCYYTDAIVFTQIYAALCCFLVDAPDSFPDLTESDVGHVYRGLRDYGHKVPTVALAVSIVTIDCSYENNRKAAKCSIATGHSRDLFILSFCM
jgi:hypothetical protein